MDEPRFTHTCSVSTCCRPDRAKIGRSRRSQGDSAAQPHRWYGLRWRDPSKPLTVTITYRGGNNAWVEVKARGGRGYFTGCTTLIDMINEIAGRYGYPERG